MAKRLSDAFVLKRVALNDGSISYVVVESAASGTEAQAKAMKIAEQNPGVVFVPACLWPPIMAQEVRKVNFVNPDDPNDDVTETADDVDAEGTSSSPVKPEVKEPVRAAEKPVEAKALTPAAPKAEAKPVVKAETPKPAAEPVQTPTPKPAEVPVSTPKAEAPKPVAAKAPVAKAPPAPKAPVAHKAEEKQGDGYSELFGSAAPAEPEGFVNADDKDSGAIDAKDGDEVPNLF